MGECAQVQSSMLLLARECEKTRALWPSRRITLLSYLSHDPLSFRLLMFLGLYITPCIPLLFICNIEIITIPHGIKAQVNDLGFLSLYFSRAAEVSPLPPRILKFLAIFPLFLTIFQRLSHPCHHTCTIFLSPTSSWQQGYCSSGRS